VPDSAAVTLLTISENATYLVDDLDRRLVVRVYRPDYHGEAEIRSELQWIEAVRASGVVETPRPVPTIEGSLLAGFGDNGRRRWMAAFEFLTGREPEPSGDFVGWYRRLGAVSATLHRQSRDWARPPGFRRKIWTFDTIIGAKAHWGDWRAGPGLDAPGRAVLDRTAGLLQAMSRRYGTGPDRFGLIHCDMRPANLLVEGERLGLIDFDDCGSSWFVYDFAAAVSFLEHEPYLPDLMAAWVEGYRTVAPLSAEDEAALPMAVMLRRMQLTAWIASHAETPTARALGPAYTHGTVDLAERFLSARG
jgi:Ser/Thr protein kinase RdoA (MazF antagonist)